MKTYSSIVGERIMNKTRRSDVGYTRGMMNLQPLLVLSLISTVVGSGFGIRTLTREE